MVNQAIGKRLAALEAATYAPITKAAFERLGARAQALWSTEERRAFFEALEASNALTPEVLAWIKSDAELSALWREICRLGWLEFYSQTGSVFSEHEYFS